MARQPKTTYICTNCGSQSSTWSGKCFDCGEWGTLDKLETSDLVLAGKQVSGKTLQVSKLSEAKTQIETTRLTTKFEELDQVLGGGIVAGSVILLAGQPGIGKSTLLMQLAAGVSRDSKVLYVSGEESEHQVAARAARLKLDKNQLDIVSTNSTDDITVTIKSSDYKLVVVDSIQTISTNAVTGSQGGVSQIVSSAQMLIAAAKQTQTSIILVGHVTKEGSIAGPKILEHIVDVVMQLEGDKFAGFKLLRANKNRYGSIDEVAVLEMSPIGLVAVDNPSKALLAERILVDGSVIFAAVEGNRPLLVEIQALTNPSEFGYPKRTAVGINQNRLNLLVAVLEKRTKLSLAKTDIYVSVASGINLTDPAADLAVCMAIASSVKGLALNPDTVVYGEVGLGGEVRSVTYADKRNKEAKKLGFSTIIGPVRGEILELRSALNTHLKSTKPK
ncbi:DNA repair protein RadA [Candidatus Saccharibacteria bacterium]|nr:DNA repair protein RadA [Candidatus Saccharibacteria bacterium]MCB9821598.1 DNA repair protein RadA [Candidatus Nomurabacteria bacterium]